MDLVQDASRKSGTNVAARQFRATVLRQDAYDTAVCQLSVSIRMGVGLKRHSSAQKRWTTTDSDVRTAFAAIFRDKLHFI